MKVVKKQSKQVMTPRLVLPKPRAHARACERRRHTVHLSFLLQIVLVKPVIFVEQDCVPVIPRRVGYLVVPLSKHHQLTPL
jgi:hypothetical protein